MCEEEPELKRECAWCNFIARGEDEDVIVDQMVPHIKEKHPDVVRDQMEEHMTDIMTELYWMTNWVE